MRVLLVDNHDSYTYNLAHLTAGATGHWPTILTNDDPAWQELDTADYDALLISPGPGRPQNPRDLGHVPDLLARTNLPVLGVCLGHQAIAHLAGADVTGAPRPLHGHLTRVRHTGTGLMTHLPQDFTAVRYHSLAVAQPLPEHLHATAHAEDGVLMGLAHRDLPRWGVQFHPESVASEGGRTLIDNFAALARPRATGTAHTPAPEPAPETPNDTTPTRPAPLVEVLPWETDTEAAFERLYGSTIPAFWLDSSLPQGPARFSFLGAATGEVLTHHVDQGNVHVRHADGSRHHESGDIFTALQRRRTPAPTSPDLPFDFTGGHVGYFGYELKAHCGGRAAHTAPTPDAVWMRCDRFVAVDHHHRRTYLVSNDHGPHARQWLEHTRRTLTDLPPLPAPTPPTTDHPDPADLLERDHAGYLTDIKECLAQLTQGESYEICLTDRVHLPDDDTDDLELYRRLRRANPAPYAALLRLDDLTVLSCSPERFLRVDPDGMAESRPIKGTAPRHSDPDTDTRAARALATDDKTRAENLMIVDLLRNDLGRVCRTGSVEVPAFMYTESYASVHQLVSTVRGHLRPGVDALDAVHACFPGGSMTGAPKPRTMEIIDRLESSARGVYSGALGYIADTGAADLNIVIRTAVRAGGRYTVGAGGAIVLDSDPQAEYEEMLLKAAVPLTAR